MRRSSSSTSPKIADVPGGEVRVGHLARVEDRPLLRQVLPRREARRVVARVGHLLLRLRPEDRHRLPTLASRMVTQTLRVAPRARAYVGARGRDAADYLQRMVSNDVEALAVGEACDALLLTAKARLIAPLRVWRRGEEDFLLLTEPELGEVVLATLLRSRFAAKVALAPRSTRARSSSAAPRGSRPPTTASLRSRCSTPTLDGEPVDLELLRIEAGTPAWGKELDDRILPAEAGLEATHISFTKGCYPGPGAGRPPPPPRPREPRAAPPRARRRRAAGVRRGALARRQGRGPHHLGGAPARTGRSPRSATSAPRCPPTRRSQSARAKCVSAPNRTASSAGGHRVGAGSPWPAHPRPEASRLAFLTPA